ncbi:hypothetical protein [Streptomyces sp. NPDC002580]
MSATGVDHGPDSSRFQAPQGFVVQGAGSVLDRIAGLGGSSEDADLPA